MENIIVEVGKKEEAEKVLKIWESLGNKTRDDRDGFIKKMFDSYGKSRPVIYLQKNFLESFANYEWAKGKKLILISYKQFMNKYGPVSKHVKQIKFESYEKENYKMGLIERLEKIMMKEKILKEEAYEITVKRNEAPKIAPILTNLRNVTVTKSFDLNDLERHRFMVSSKVDPYHIEDMLKDELKRKKVPVNIAGIKVSLATPKSLEEELKEDK